MCLLATVININWLYVGNGTDYTSTLINATFPVGTDSTTINVTVTKDDIAEETETFNLNFSLPLSLSGKVIPGVITTATGTIVDDTGKREMVNYHSIN